MSENTKRSGMSQNIARRRTSPRDVTEPRAPKVIVQTDLPHDVFVDDRGVVFCVDRHAGGLYTLEMKL